MTDHNIEKIDRNCISYTMPPYLGVAPLFIIISIPLHHPLLNPSLSFTLNIKTHNIICKKNNNKNLRHIAKFFNLILYLRWNENGSRFREKANWRR